MVGFRTQFLIGSRAQIFKVEIVGFLRKLSVAVVILKWDLGCHLEIRLGPSILWHHEKLPLDCSLHVLLTHTYLAPFTCPCIRVVLFQFNR